MRELAEILLFVLTLLLFACGGAGLVFALGWFLFADFMDDVL